jgi:hypothetical protein
MPAAALTKNTASLFCLNNGYATVKNGSVGLPNAFMVCLIA